MASHKDLTGVDLHEPKGASTASSGQVYVADGLGSGAWTALDTAKNVAVCFQFKDVSTAGTQYAVSPVAGTVTAIYLVIEGTLATADTNMTFAINGTSIDSSGITIAFTGSMGGDEYDSAPSGHNTVVAGDVFDITSDGGSTNTVDAHVVFLIAQ